MIYLLMLGWPWFAGAFALGALVGFLTFSRARDTAFSGGWVILAGIFALAGGFAVSQLAMLAGREAAMLDIALIASVAYAAGLPIGGVMKSLGGVEAPAPRPTAAPVVVTPPRIAPPEPILLPQALEVMRAETLDEAPPVAQAPVAVAEVAAPEPAAPQPATPRAKKSAPGAKPETLEAPRNGAPDDLSRIKGVGPKSREKLHALGVFHYDQIAAWNLDNAKWVGVTIGAPGRVERDKWIQQARALAGAGMEH
jgi:predicted flap endonuclease-1-like 5' DNA nuclease